MIDYSRLLKPEDDASPDAVRDNYRRLAKENHPDLFPEAERHAQTMIMMKINEAYLRILDEGGKTTGPCDGTARTSKRNVRPPAKPPKDPAYVLYKAGYDHLQKGQAIFNLRWFTKEKVDEPVPLYTPREVIRAAQEALAEYIIAYRYFMTVRDELPDSAWSADADEKLTVLARMNERYNAMIQKLKMNWEVR